MHEMNHTNHSPINYPPEILLVKENPTSLSELKQKLESKGCHVRQIDLSAQGLSMVRNKSLELIVLNAEHLDDSDIEILHQLQCAPGPFSVPIVILTSRNADEMPEDRWNSDSPVYYLPADETFTDTQLWQIIERTHYMIYRYV